MTREKLNQLFNETVEELRKLDDIGVATANTRDLKSCFYGALDCLYCDDEPEWEPGRIAAEMENIQIGVDEKYA